MKIIAITDSGEHTRPRVSFLAPPPKRFVHVITEKVRAGESAIAGTRGRVLSPK